RERVERRANHVDRIARAVALREHVADSRALEHRTHRAARYDAGAFRRRLHEHARSAVAAAELVLQRVLLEVHGVQVLARGLHGLLDRERELARLAVAEADATGAVADDGQRGETELPAALDDLRDTVHRDELLLKFFDVCHSFAL